MPDKKAKRRLDRRSFLRNSGLAAGGAAGIAAIAPFATAITHTVAENGSPLAEPRRAADPSALGPRDDSTESAAATATPSLSRRFARWVAALRYEDLPLTVIDRAKGLTLQALSSALLGSQL